MAGEGPRTVEDVTCLACGCLCDDVAVTVAGERIVEARHACEAGRAWFLADHGPGTRPSATIGGRTVEPSEAIARAAEILKSARAPAVLGLSRSTIEAQGAAVALADRIGAVIEPEHAAEATAGHRAFARVGRVAATLGEIKNRADIVVFWGVDPVRTHPRHFERYSVEPEGRFVDRRTVVVVDADRTATAGRADLFIPMDPGRQFEALWCLRGLVQGLAIDPARAERASGIGWGALRALADVLTRARYGVLFTGPGLATPAEAEAALSLVRDLNGLTRFVALTLGGPGNPSGAEAILTWQAGFPLGVDLAPGAPRTTAGDAVTARIAAGAVDAALIVGTFEGIFPSVPTIVVGPGATASDRPATVAIATATPGIHSGGTVLRVDGVSLPLRPAVATVLPTERVVLEAIAAALGTEGRKHGDA